MLQVRDAVREVFRTQLSDGDDRNIVEARNQLDRTYDFFVSRHGPLNARENVKAFAGDPDHPLLLSLEEFNPETNRATKTPIFNRRTLERYRPVERVEAASEALLVSLNETGAINWPRMESLTARCAADLQDELGPLAYRNPEGGEWETADSYLSGNVRAKLVVAQAAERFDSAYQRNVEALREVQPDRAASYPRSRIRTGTVCPRGAQHRKVVPAFHRLPCVHSYRRPDRARCKGGARS